MAAVAFEEGSGFDGERLMQDVAFDMARRAERNFARANAALNAPSDRDVFGDDFAVNERLVANYQARTAHIAFDATINLDVAT